MELIFQDLCVSVDKKQILKNVSGIAYPGKLLAIMGPSGAGKTTLLNTIAGRMPLDSGAITLNGVILTKAVKRKLCYVLQEDIFFPNLTLQETLHFSAMIRLPDSMPKQEKLAKVKDTVEALDLTKCLDTIIGDVWIRGLSGGEKKRASIACELMTDPTMILLDEPTSGLDYSTAYSLVEMLKNYANSHNKTVVATIHQPSSYIFYQFDKLLLMSEGEVAYFGATALVADFFDRAGVPMSSHYNPADFILEKLKEDEKTRMKIVAAAYRQRYDADWPEELKGNITCKSDSHLKSEDQNSYQKKQKASGVLHRSKSNESESVHVSLINLDESESSRETTPNINNDKWQSGFLTQYIQITIRTFRNSKAQIFNRFKVLETVVLCVLVSLIWFQLPRTEETLRDRMGVIFYISMHWGFTPLFDTVTSFPGERIVINKERSAGWYRLSAYYLAKMTSELPLILLQPVLFMTVVYWSVGLNGASAFFATLGTIFIHSIAGQSIGLFLGIACMDIRRGMTVATISIMGIMLLGGFYTRSLPSWLFWVKYLSFLYYTFNCLMFLEFHNGSPVLCAQHTNISESLFSSCSQPGNLYIPSHKVLEYYDITWPFWQYLLPLFIYIIAFRVAGYLVLRYIHKPH